VWAYSRGQTDRHTQTDTQTLIIYAMLSDVNPHYLYLTHRRA